MEKYKSQKGSIKIFLVPIIIISFIFVIILFAMTHNIKRYFYDLKQEEALKMAQNISVNLTNAGVMSDTANMLLEDNLLTSLKATALHRDIFSDELLLELGDTFEIDEIYVYNSEGVIEYSYSGKYIGWESYVGHPVYNFINGNEDILVEDIRKDSDSDLYYKYGYIKTSDDTFVQIGILAEKVIELLDSFELQYLLEDMMVDNSIIQLFSMDKYYRVTASTDKDFVGSRVDINHIESDIENGRIHDHIITIDGLDIYEIFIPLEYESDIISSFGIQYSMDDVIPIVRNNTLISLLGLIIVYSSLVFSFYTVHNRNKKLEEIAFYDTVTGLPNTDFLKEQLGKDLIRNRDNKAIIMIKCDNLNIIHLSLGYEHGNLLLKEMGSRIKQIENKKVNLFRFTAEKFVLYVKAYEETEELLDILEEIEDLLNSPFTINNMKEHVITKIGVMEYNLTDKTVDQLLQDATIAIKHVDINRNGNFSFYDESMEQDIKREEAVEKDIKAAIAGEDSVEVFLQYQPIVDFKSDKIVGFEALARMNSEQLGFVSPVEFISTAERKQLIIPLSELILKTACRFISDLIDLGFDDIRISVNISTIHLFREDFVSSILDIVGETRISGENLELEITETSFMKNFTIVNEKLKLLRENNIRIALDDFGTGYSSFDRLNELNVDTLKIDRHFIHSINDKNKSSVITKDIISIAHKLGLKTVAEGVETQEQKNYLMEYDCDKFQGYVFSKPIPEEEAIKLLVEGKK